MNGELRHPGFLGDLLEGWRPVGEVQGVLERPLSGYLLPGPAAGWVHRSAGLGRAIGNGDHAIGEDGDGIVCLFPLRAHLSEFLDHVRAIVAQDATAEADIVLRQVLEQRHAEGSIEIE